MNAQGKVAKPETVEQVLDRGDEERAALIAYYRCEGPWFQKIENLKRGDPLTDEDKRVLAGIRAAVERLAA